MTPHDPITSPANPRVRQASLLRAAEERRRSGLTLVDGRRELSRAAEAGAEIVEVFVDADHAAGLHAWLEPIARGGARLTRLAGRAFARVAFGERNEGVVAVVRFQAAALERSQFAPTRPVLVVEGVEKPGNLGAILRTADAAGMAGVVVCDGRTDPANPAVIRASLGTVFTVPLAVATTGETIAWCRASGRPVVAAMPDGTRLWHEPRLAGGTAILLGSEAHGLSASWHDAAAAGHIVLETIRLPMKGAADSLNLSVTAAVLAYEAVRQAALVEGGAR